MKKFFSAIMLFLPAVAKAQNLTLTNPLGQVNGPGDLFGRIIGNFIIPALGTAALLMFLYAGFLMITSQGNEEKAKKGQQAMTWAAIGLAAAFVGYIVINYYISALTQSVS